MLSFLPSIYFHCLKYHFFFQNFKNKLTNSFVIYHINHHKFVLKESQVRVIKNHSCTPRENYAWIDFVGKYELQCMKFNKEISIKAYIQKIVV